MKRYTFGLYAAVAATFATTPLAAQHVPGIDVWLDAHNQSAAQGATVVAHAAADPGAYVVVFRVTPDRRIVVMSPRSPYATYRVPAAGLRSEGLDASFTADAVDGTGYVFAVSSDTPFNFTRVRNADSWNTAALGTPPSGDAAAVADWFIRQIIPTRNTAYGFNDVAYYVGVTPPSQTADDETSTRGHTVVYAAPVYYGDPYYNAYGYGYGSGYGYAPWDSYYTWGAYPRTYRQRYYNPGYTQIVTTPPAASNKVCLDGSVVPRFAPCPSRSSGNQQPGQPGRHTPRPRPPMPPRINARTPTAPNAPRLVPNRTITPVPNHSAPAPRLAPPQRPAPAPRMAPAPRPAPAPKLAPPPRLAPPPHAPPPPPRHESAPREKV